MLAGTSNQKLAPWPSLDRTPMRPPISSTSDLQMARPRPVPPLARLIETSACENLSNRRLLWSGPIPTPVSVTLNRSRPPRRVDRQRVLTVTDPSRVNFTALLSRFTSTCRRRATSPTIRAGVAASSSTLTPRPCAAASRAIRPVASSTSRRTDRGWASSAMRPASSLE